MDSAKTAHEQLGLRPQLRKNNTQIFV